MEGITRKVRGACSPKTNRDAAQLKNDHHHTPRFQRQERHQRHTQNYKNKKYANYFQKTF